MRSDVQGQSGNMYHVSISHYGELNALNLLNLLNRDLILLTYDSEVAQDNHFREDPITLSSLCIISETPS